MNNQEAKKILQRDLAIMIENKCLPDDIETIKIAISALGAIEQFRWERDIAIEQLSELGLGLGQKVDHVKEALDKQTPMKPDYIADGYADGLLCYDYAKCPICGHDFEYGINDWECDYCSGCGQKLDWEGGATDE